MELVKDEQAPQLDVNQLKEIHDIYAATAEILAHRVAFYHEEFDGVKKMISFYKAILADYRAKIEALEPKKVETDGQAKES